MIAKDKFYLALGRKIVSLIIQRCFYPETFPDAEVDITPIQYAPCLFDSDDELAKAKAQLQIAKKHCCKIIGFTLGGVCRCCVVIGSYYGKFLTLVANIRTSKDFP